MSTTLDIDLDADLAEEVRRKQISRNVDAYVRERDGKPGDDRPPPVQLRPAAEEWAAKLKALRLKGLSAPRAVSQLAKAEPALRERLVSEATAEAATRKAQARADAAEWRNRGRRR